MATTTTATTTTGSSVVVVDSSLSPPPSHIETSLKDERLYESFVVNENKLRVLVISDIKADKAAAALDVGIGQYSDPSHLQGCAHFLEHLLFMGTTKYPNENEYSKYLNQHGGYSNAYTDLEHTNYHFTVHPTHLEGALDRLAQFFIEPLLKEDSVDRERQAVHSEHEKNVQQDVWRFMQLSRSLADTTHPHSKFGSGNATTLNVANVRDCVYEFYKQHYSSNLMTLVVYGTESIKQLKEWVVQYFTAIPNYNYERPIISPTPFPQLKPMMFKTTTTTTTTDDGVSKEEEATTVTTPTPPPLIKYYKIIPVEATHSIELSFPMHETSSLYLSKPLQYLSHLIGHEGRGSILSYLKHKGWAQDLMAGTGRSCTSWSMFVIQVTVTELGLQQWYDVVHVLFSYLNMLRDVGIQEWIQEETKKVANCNFLFLSEQRPMEYTSSLALYMHLYPPQHVLSGPYKIYQKEPTHINKILQSYLVPSNMMLFVSSPTFAVTVAEEQTTNFVKEKWYGTEYQEEQVETSIVESWINATVEEEEEETKGKDDDDSTIIKLSLPERNDMIATNFDLVMEQDESLKSLPKDQPVLLELDDNDDDDSTTTSSSSSCRLWYKPDNIFERPKCNVFIQLATPFAYESVETAVLCRLWQSCLEEQCNEFTYLASMASLDSGIMTTRLGIELYLSGYNHKLTVLLERWIGTLVTFQELNNNALSDKLVTRLIAKFQQELENFFVYDPYQHAIYGMDEIMMEKKYSPQERLQVLKTKSITKQDILKFHQQFLSSFQVQILVHGNVSPTEAKMYAKMIRDGLKQEQQEQPLGGMSSSSSSYLQNERLVQLSPSTTTYYRMKEFNSENTNSALLSMYLIGNNNDGGGSPSSSLSTRQKAQLAFLQMLLKEPAFHELRTEQQLGYIVFTNVQTWRNQHYRGLYVLIQSDTYDPIVLNHRVDEFIANFRTNVLLSLSDEELESQKIALIQVLLEKRKNLWEESSRYWDAIGTYGHYDFHRHEHVAEEAKSLTRSDLLQFWDKYFLIRSSPKYTKLAIQVFSHSCQEKMMMEKEVENENENVVVVTNAKEFKRTMPLCPLPKPVNVDQHKMENFIKKDDGKNG